MRAFEFRKAEEWCLGEVRMLAIPNWDSPSRVYVSRSASFRVTLKSHSAVRTVEGRVVEGCRESGSMETACSIRPGLESGEELTADGVLQRSGGQWWLTLWGHEKEGSWELVLRMGERTGKGVYQLHESRGGLWGLWEEGVADLGSRDSG